MNFYELYPRANFSITLFGNVYNPDEKKTITGSISYELFRDIADLKGLPAAKDAWWEIYEWIEKSYDTHKIQTQKG